MTSDTTAAPRANRNGSPCPTWCASDHGKLLIADPQVYLTVHASAPMSDESSVHVRVTQDGHYSCEHGQRKVAVQANGSYLAVPPDRAGDLADLLEALEDLVRYEPSRLREYAAQVRAAAALAGESA